jgi:hypothetical protein
VRYFGAKVVIVINPRRVEISFVKWAHSNDGIPGLDEYT